MNKELNLFEKDNNLYSTVERDEITDSICTDFDINFTGENVFAKHSKHNIEDYGIGLIVGNSGGGKTTLLKEYGEFSDFEWNNNKSVASNFKTYDDAKIRLMGVGLNSVPTWLKPYRVLSNGEKYRAEMAINIESYTIFDEFTSIVDRDVAKSMSVSIRKLVTKLGLKNVTFASPHRDIIEWLEPDWVYDVNTMKLTLKENLRKRESITLKFKRNEKSLWKLFSPHHYLDNKLNKACRFFTVYWNDRLVACLAILPMPSGTVKNAFREHRLVVLPEFQGLSFGMLVSNSIAQLYKDDGKTMYGKTSHPKIGQYRNRSEIWKETSSSGKKTAPNKNFSNKTIRSNNITLSHRFIGDFKIDYIVNQNEVIMKNLF